MIKFSLTQIVYSVDLSPKRNLNRWGTGRRKAFPVLRWMAGNVFGMAKKKGDETLLLYIRGQDLFACEAKYHKACLLKYSQKPEKSQSTHNGKCERQTELEEAHKTEPMSLSMLINTEIIENKILKLTDLLVT